MAMHVNRRLPKTNHSKMSAFAGRKKFGEGPSVGVEPFLLFRRDISEAAEPDWELISATERKLDCGMSTWHTVSISFFATRI